VLATQLNDIRSGSRRVTPGPAARQLSKGGRTGDLLLAGVVRKRLPPLAGRCPDSSRRLLIPLSSGEQDPITGLGIAARITTLFKNTAVKPFHRWLPRRIATRPQPFTRHNYRSQTTRWFFKNEDTLFLNNRRLVNRLGPIHFG